ncbi:MAG TPA: carotenoid biosynthesis protein [Patescibacteria group bacterium]|nr:carotenoid biosynthesis protein [Patescibacteria group bacterium]
MIFWIINIGIILLFAGLLLVINHNERRMAFFAILYAILFENVNMLLSRGQIAGYSYNSQFVLCIFDTPLFVILSWSLLIVTGRILARQLFSTYWQQLLGATMLVLLIDLSIDIFAIRLQFWSWNGYTLQDGFFGVPSINYVGWFLVTLTFYIVYDVCKKRTLLVWCTPAIAYILFLPLINGYNRLTQFFAIGKNNQIIIVFILFFLMYLILIIIAFRHRLRSSSFYIKNKKIQFSLLARYLFHLFSFSAIILYHFNTWSLILAFFIIFFLDVLFTLRLHRT